LEMWKSYGEVTDAFPALASAPQYIKDDVLRKLQRIVILVYDRTSNMESIEDARK
jgi:hypothetical protein